MTPLDSMNPAQREAITLSPDVSNIKDILIVAGAGSGNENTRPPLANVHP